MPIPDHVVFGPGLDNDLPVSFEFARSLKQNSQKVKLLKRRLDAFLINQVQPIAQRDETGQPIIWSPFPLTAITCMASETLGRLISSIGDLKKSGKSDSEISRAVTIKVFGRFDKKLTRQLGKEFKKNMTNIWPHDDIKSIKSSAEILYKYLRNSFNHGYRAKNVFLNHELIDGWTLGDGFLIINPYWFWDRFQEVYVECFQQIMMDKKDNKMRQNALNYFNRLIA